MGRKSTEIFTHKIYVAKASAKRDFAVDYRATLEQTTGSGSFSPSPFLHCTSPRRVKKTFYYLFIIDEK
jgi:hypothetical protein